MSSCNENVSDEPWDAIEVPANDPCIEYSISSGTAKFTKINY